jgi:hypothetical protein
MAQQTPIGLDKSYEATAQLPVNSLVKLNATGAMILTTAATDVPIGMVVANNGANAPFQCTVRLAGIAQAISDGTATITPGARLVASAGTSGSVVTDASTLGTVNKKRSIGIALTVVAATAGLLVDVLIQPELIPST